MVLKNKRYFLVPAFAVGILSFFASYFFFFSQPPSTVRYGNVQIGNKNFRVELAQTPGEIKQGLSDRDKIGADGLLFVLPLRTRPSFWMYHMRFPLDFIWIDQNKIIDIHENVPIPAENGAVPTVQPDFPASHVLEVPAGFIQTHGVTVGQDVLLEM